MRYRIYPYKSASEGATAIAEAIGGKKIRLQNSTYQPAPDDVIINWGNSSCPFPNALNKDISATLDKLKFFERLAGTGLTPKFATTAVQAAAELAFPVFCRTQLKGKDGEGIVVADAWMNLVPAPLYVQRVAKTKEYRVHVGRFGNEIIPIGHQQKVHHTVEGQHPDIWTGDSTKFVWTVNGAPVSLPAAVKTCVNSAFEKFPELTFGAFDVVYDAGSNTAYVLEINSAPMQTPETTARYKAFFQKFAPPEPVAAPVTAAAAPTPVALKTRPAAAQSDANIVSGILEAIKAKPALAKQIIALLS